MKFVLLLYSWRYLVTSGGKTESHAWVVQRGKFPQICRYRTGLLRFPVPQKVWQALVRTQVVSGMVWTAGLQLN